MILVFGDFLGCFHIAGICLKENQSYIARIMVELKDKKPIG